MATRIKMPGQRAGKALAAATVAYTASAPGQSFLVSLFVAGYLTHGGLSRTAFSALYAVATLCSAGWVLVLGRLAERVGLRGLWLSVAVALAGACWLASVSGGLILVAASLALLRMFGQGSLPLLGTVITNRNFGRSLGKAVALSRSGHAVASVALPPLVATLIVAVGWSGTYRVLSAALLVLLVPASLLVDDGPIPAPSGGLARLRAGDADFGLSPALWRSARLPSFDLPTRHAGGLLVALSVSPLVTTAVSVQAVSLMARRGVGLTGVGVALSLLGVTSALTTVVTGVLADRWPPGRFLVASNAGLITALGLLVGAAPAMSYLAFAFMGVAAGLGGIMAGTVWPRVYGRAQIAKLQGISTGVQIASAALGPLALAGALSLTGSYRAGLIGMIVLAGAAIAAAGWWSRPGPLADLKVSAARI